VCLYLSKTNRQRRPPTIYDSPRVCCTRHALAHSATIIIDNDGHCCCRYTLCPEIFHGLWHSRHRRRRCVITNCAHNLYCLPSIVLIYVLIVLPCLLLTTASPAAVCNLKGLSRCFTTHYRVV